MARVDPDTDLGGAADRFPATRCSLVRAASSADPAERQCARQTLLSAYWKPIYKYIRYRWQLANEDAKDLTQGFLARAIEGGFFDRFDPAKGRFRTFVRVCVDRFLANEHRAAGRRITAWPLDFDAAEDELRDHPTAAGVDPDEYFRQEWLRGLFAQAVEDLRLHCAETGKQLHFALFERYDLDDTGQADRLTYAQLAEEHGLPVTQVTNYLAWARRQFRERLLQALRASTGSDEDFQHEVRRLFGEGAP
jgi:RNA polymerase sigma factor (sigma-70 family)